MNASVYLFGEFNSGYSQYPDDYASLIFQKFSTNAKSTTQIAIHRDGNLVYYGYIRKLQQDRYIGLCVVLNGLILTRIDGLFSLFENTISNLVTNGKLIHFNEQGDLVTSVNKLYLNIEEIDLLTESLRAGFKRFEAFSAPLPAVSYGTSKDSFKDFVVNDDQEEIIKSSYTNGYTYIYKSMGFNTAQLNSYKRVLSRAYEEKKELTEKYRKLQSEYMQTLKQKKQYRNVILLILAVLACGVGLFFLNISLNDTKNELIRAKNNIRELNSTVSNLSEELDNTKTSLWNTSKERDEAQQKMNTLKDKVGSSMPIIITDIQIANTNNSGDIETDYGNTIYSSSTMYLKPKISYTGIKTGENINLNVKFYTPSGLSSGSSSPYGCSYSTSMYVYSGDNTETLSGWGGSSQGSWRSGQYRFEIWYNDVCLKSKSFTIY